MGELLKTIGDYALKVGQGIRDNSRVLKQGSSIASEAAKSTYYFPVLVSKNVTQPSAVAITNSLEFAYMSFMRACFSLTPAIVVKGDVNVDEYLKRFHQNIGVSGNKYILDVDWNSIGHNLLEQAYKDAYAPYKMLVNESINMIIDQEYLDSINEGIANPPKKPDDGWYSADRVNNMQMAAYAAGRHAGRKEKVDVDEIYTSGLIDGRKKADKLSKAEIDKLKKISKEEIVKLKSDLDKANADKAALEEKLKSPNDPKYYVTSWKTGEAAKKNALQPLTSVATCTFVIKGAEKESIEVNIPFGVKAVIHSAEPSEYVDRLIASILDNRGGNITSFVRWTSGEVNSLGDMLFGTTKMKRDLTGDDDLSRWFKVIEERKRINKLPLANLFKKPFLPNMTMLISSYDVEAIRQRTGIDLLKDMKYTMKLMKNCFLLGLVIMDESTDTVYVLYDGQSSFDEIPLDALKRQNDKDQSDFARMMKALVGR